VLLEQSANQCGEALDAVTVMLEEVLESSKGSADTFTDLGYEHCVSLGICLVLFLKSVGLNDAHLS
jgi:hypothetical protein